jgi:hypothetical protein
MAVMRLLIVLAAAAVAIPPSLRGVDVDHVSMRKKDVVLTFDAGGDSDGAWHILRTLQRKHVAATFFLTGRWVNQYRLLARVIGRRYSVANHTYHHLPMTRLSDAKALDVLAGRHPGRFLEAPDEGPLLQPCLSGEGGQLRERQPDAVELRLDVPLGGIGRVQQGEQPRRRLRLSPRLFIHICIIQ